MVTVYLFPPAFVNRPGDLLFYRGGQLRLPERPDIKYLSVFIRSALSASSEYNAAIAGIA
jgi:hypothetical protein